MSNQDSIQNKLKSYRLNKKLSSQSMYCLDNTSQFDKGNS